MADVEAKRCRWCGEPEHINAVTGAATGLYCPLVKAFGLNDQGAIVRVEFFTPADWPAARATEDDDDVPDYPRLGQ